MSQLILEALLDSECYYVLNITVHSIFPGERDKRYEKEHSLHSLALST